MFSFPAFPGFFQYVAPINRDPANTDNIEFNTFPFTTGGPDTSTSSTSVFAVFEPAGASAEFVAAFDRLMELVEEFEPGTPVRVEDLPTPFEIRDDILNQSITLTVTIPVIEKEVVVSDASLNELICRAAIVFDGGFCLVPASISQSSSKCSAETNECRFNADTKTFRINPLFRRFEFEFSVDLKPFAIGAFDVGNKFLTTFPFFRNGPIFSIIEVTNVTDNGDTETVQFRIEGISLVKIHKEITGGPDRPDALDGSGVSDGEIDVVIPIRQVASTEYGFDMTYENLGGPAVLITDAVPSEWQVTMVAGNSIIDGSGGGSDGNAGTVLVMPANGKPNNKSATIIEWAPDATSESSTITVTVETRSRSGNSLPRDCGALFVNDKARVFEVDEFGEPLRDTGTGDLLPTLFESDALIVAAVDDVNADDEIARNGTGDEDGDGLDDFVEVVGIETDPCLADTDGDGTQDGSDSDPLDPFSH